MKRLQWQRISRGERLLAVVLVTGTVLGAAVFRTFPQFVCAAIPPCTFFSSTGLHCAGCGASRSVCSLLHFDLPQAFAYNQLLVVMTPFLLCWYVLQTVRATTGRRLVTARPMPTWVPVLCIALLIGFWVVRDLPFEFCRVLTPHELQGRGYPQETAMSARSNTTDQAFAAVVADPASSDTSSRHFVSTDTCVKDQ